jgi:hypothetical protein
MSMVETYFYTNSRHQSTFHSNHTAVDVIRATRTQDHSGNGKNGRLYSQYTSVHHAQESVSFHIRDLDKHKMFIYFKNLWGKDEEN